MNVQQLKLAVPISAVLMLLVGGVAVQADVIDNPFESSPPVEPVEYNYTNQSFDFEIDNQNYGDSGEYSISRNGWTGFTDSGETNIVCNKYFEATQGECNLRIGDSFSGEMAHHTVNNPVGNVTMDVILDDGESGAISDDGVPYTMGNSRIRLNNSGDFIQLKFSGGGNLSVTNYKDFYTDHSAFTHIANVNQTIEGDKWAELELIDFNTAKNTIGKISFNDTVMETNYSYAEPEAMSDNITRVSFSQRGGAFGIDDIQFNYREKVE